MKYLLILSILVIAGCGKEIPKIEVTQPEPTSTPDTTSDKPSKSEDKKESEPNRLTPTPTPDSEETPSPTPTPVPSAVPIVTLSYAYLQSPEICSALTNWNPDANTIVFVSSYSGLKHYVFSKNEIYLSNINGSSKQVLSAPLTIASSGYGHDLTYCCIDLVAGQLPRVRPLCAN